MKKNNKEALSLSRMGSKSPRCLESLFLAGALALPAYGNTFIRVTTTDNNTSNDIGGGVTLLQNKPGAGNSARDGLDGGDTVLVEGMVGSSPSINRAIKSYTLLVSGEKLEADTRPTLSILNFDGKLFYDAKTDVTENLSLSGASLNIDFHNGASNVYETNMDYTISVSIPGQFTQDGNAWSTNLLLNPTQMNIIPFPGLTNIVKGSDNYFGTFAVSRQLKNVAPVATGYATNAVEDTNLVVDLSDRGTDANGDSLTARILSTNNVFLTSIGSNRFNASFPLDFNGNAGFTYDFSDGKTNSNVANGTIGVASVIDAPSGMTLSRTNINENMPTNSLIGYLTPQGVDPSTFNLLSGQGDNDMFALQNGTNLVSSVGFNYEGKSNLVAVVEARNSGGAITSQYDVKVGDVNEVGTGVGLDNLLVAENSPAGSVVGNLSTSGDPDANETHIYSFVSGVNNNPDFVITNGVLKSSRTFNYEAESSKVVDVRSTDKVGNTIDRRFTIGIDDVAEAPSNILLSRQDIDENLPAGSEIGTIGVVDEDGNTNHSIYLVPGAGDNNLLSITNGNRLVTAGTFNYEVKPSLTAVIGASDSAGARTNSFLVGVNDRNDRPNAFGYTNSVPEDATLDLTLLGTDEDQADQGNLVARILANNSPATLTHLSGNTYRLRAPADWNGLVEFDYDFSDGKTNSAPANARVAFTPVPDNPLLTIAEGFARTEDSGNQELLYTVFDPDLTATNLVARVKNGQGSVSVDTVNGKLVYSHPTNWNGDVELEVDATDENLGFTRKSVYGTIVSTPDPTLITLAPSSPVKGYWTNSVPFEFDVTDADGRAITNNVVGQNGVVSYLGRTGNKERFEFRANSGVLGLQRVTADFGDGYGSSANANFDVDVVAYPGSLMNRIESGRDGTVNLIVENVPTGLPADKLKLEYKLGLDAGGWQRYDAVPVADGENRYRFNGVPINGDASKFYRTVVVE
ncbi:MAG: cadherin-like domain-containing protein [Nanoarchaeota archaeon]